MLMFAHCLITWLLVAMLIKLIKFSTTVILLLVIIGLVLFIILDHGIYSGKGASLTFRNESGLTITSATIDLSGKTCSVKKLEDTGEIICYFADLTDSGYNVQVELINGSKFKSNDLGYVCGGINFTDVITINKVGEIKLDQKSN